MDVNLYVFCKDYREEKMRQNKHGAFEIHFKKPEGKPNATLRIHTETRPLRAAFITLTPGLGDFTCESYSPANRGDLGRRQRP